MEKNEYNNGLNHFRDAQRALNHAASESSQEIRNMVNEDYTRVKETLSNIKPELMSALRGIRDASTEALRGAKDQMTSAATHAAKRVDRSVHEDSWKYIAGAAALGCVAGYMVARSTKVAS